MSKFWLIALAIIAAWIITGVMVRNANPGQGGKTTGVVSPTPQAEKN